MAFLTEADTWYVLPKLYAAGWADEQISEQKSFTDGRIVVAWRRAEYKFRYWRSSENDCRSAQTPGSEPSVKLELVITSDSRVGVGPPDWLSSSDGLMIHRFLTPGHANGPDDIL